MDCGMVVFIIDEVVFENCLCFCGIVNYVYYGVGFIEELEVIGYDEIFIV